MDTIFPVSLYVARIGFIIPEDRLFTNAEESITMPPSIA
jgi:hypothetical protein